MLGSKYQPMNNEYIFLSRLFLHKIILRDKPMKSCLIKKSATEQVLQKGFKKE
jgi:hypothetical protein